MSLKGDLAEFGLAEVLEMLGKSSKTGLLTVQTEQSPVMFALHRGNLVIGMSENQQLPDSLAELLQITTSGGKESTTPPGIGVVYGGIIKVKRGREEMADALKRLLIDGLLEAAPWTSGSFEFRHEPAFDKRPPVAVSFEELAAEAKPQLKKWAELKKKLPPDTAEIAWATLVEEETTINRTEWSLISLLTEETTFGRLRQASDLPIVQFGESVLALVGKGLIGVREKDDQSHGGAGPNECVDDDGSEVQVAKHMGGEKVEQKRISVSKIRGKYVSTRT